MYAMNIEQALNLMEESTRQNSASKATNYEMLQSRKKNLGKWVYSLARSESDVRREARTGPSFAVLAVGFAHLRGWDQNPKIRLRHLVREAMNIEQALNLMEESTLRSVGVLQSSFRRSRATSSRVAGRACTCRRCDAGSMTPPSRGPDARSKET
jgi:galactokinase